MFKKIKQLIDARIDERRKKADEPLVNHYWLLEHLIANEERFPSPEVHKATGGAAPELYETVYYDMMRKCIERRQEQRALLDRMHHRTQQEIVQQVLSR